MSWNIVCDIIYVCIYIYVCMYWFGLKRRKNILKKAWCLTASQWLLDWWLVHLVWALINSRRSYIDLRQALACQICTKRGSFRFVWTRWSRTTLSLAKLIWQPRTINALWYLEFQHRHNQYLQRVDIPPGLKAPSRDRKVRRLCQYFNTQCQLALDTRDIVWYSLIQFGIVWGSLMLFGSGGRKYWEMQPRDMSYWESRSCRSSDAPLRWGVLVQRSATVCSYRSDCECITWVKQCKKDCEGAAENASLESSNAKRIVRVQSEMQDDVWKCCNSISTAIRPFTLLLFCTRPGVYSRDICKRKMVPVDGNQDGTKDRDPPKEICLLQSHADATLCRKSGSKACSHDVSLSRGRISFHLMVQFRWVEPSSGGSSPLPPPRQRAFWTSNFGKLALDLRLG